MKTRLMIISGIIGGVISFGLTLGLMSSPITLDLKKSLDPCPYLFQEIKLLEMTSEMHLAEKKVLDKHWDLLEQYVGKKCPSYEGLDLQLTAHRQRLGILGPPIP